MFRSDVAADIFRAPMANPNVAAHPVPLTFTHDVNLLCKDAGGSWLKKASEHANFNLQPAR
jgi:hypothetical protein